MWSRINIQVKFYADITCDRGIWSARFCLFWTNLRAYSSYPLSVYAPTSTSGFSLQIEWIELRDTPMHDPILVNPILLFFSARNLPKITAHRSDAFAGDAYIPVRLPEAKRQDASPNGAVCWRSRGWRGRSRRSRVCFFSPSQSRFRVFLFWDRRPALQCRARWRRACSRVRDAARMRKSPGKQRIPFVYGTRSSHERWTRPLGALGYAARSGRGQSTPFCSLLVSHLLLSSLAPLAGTYAAPLSARVRRVFVSWGPGTPRSLLPVPRCCQIVRGSHDQRAVLYIYTRNIGSFISFFILLLLQCVIRGIIINAVLF